MNKGFEGDWLSRTYSHDITLNSSIFWQILAVFWQ